MHTLKKEAVEDLRYLLSRGYHRSSAVRFVGDRYVLDKDPRLLLYRGVFSEGVAKSHRAKLVGPERVAGSLLAIDGFNVLWTVASAMSGAPVYLCDDGFVRDLSAIHGSVARKRVSKPLKIIISTISSLKPKESLFFFDKSVSRSGDLAKRVRVLLSQNNLKGDAKAVPSPDFAVLDTGGIIATSDSVIVEKATQIFDLAGYIIRERLKVSPLKLTEF